MTLLALPWLELAILLPLVGVGCVARVRDVRLALVWCLAVTGAALACTLLVWAGYWAGVPAGGPWSANEWLFGGRAVLGVDDLSAPLLPLVALLHFVTVLATARKKIARFSFTWLMAGESLRLATFACLAPWPLVALLTLSALPPYFERRERGAGVYVPHMALFAALLVLGVSALDGSSLIPRAWASALLGVAVLVRCGVVPFHVWVLDLFDADSFGTTLAYVTPITGAYAAVRLLLPVAPEWVLDGVGFLAVLTAVYAAGMAAVQQDARRFFAYLFLSHAALVLVGLQLHTVVSLTGALDLWVSVALALTGLGLTLRALETRLGRLALTGFQGLYDETPALAVYFLLAGLASVGFPGTLGFVATELLVDGAVSANLFAGLAVVLTAALNGIAVVRAYLVLFTGGRYRTAVSLTITRRERLALLALLALILGGGLIPQSLVLSRHRAAEAILQSRAARPEPAR